jgi:hypothetical protein
LLWTIIQSSNTANTSDKQPQTLQHDFKLSPLRAHFQKSPNPPGANKLIDLPLNDFLDTEDEFNVVAAALWTLCVRYDKLEEGDKPKTRTKLREVCDYFGTGRWADE